MFYLIFDTFLEYVEGINIKKNGRYETALFTFDAYEVVVSLIPFLDSRTKPT